MLVVQLFQDHFCCYFCCGGFVFCWRLYFENGYGHCFLFCYSFAALKGIVTESLGQRSLIHNTKRLGSVTK